MPSRITLAMVCAAALATFGSARAATVFSDNFNTENGGVGQLNYANFANWNVTSGSVDLLGNGFFDFIPGNGLYVDMDGSTNQAGTIVSKRVFAPGDYTLSFDLAGSERGPEGTVTVQFGSLNQTIDLSSNTAFTLETFNVTIADPGQVAISFASDTPGDEGALLDNISLTTGVHSASRRPRTIFSSTSRRRSIGRGVCATTRGAIAATG